MVGGWQLYIDPADGIAGTTCVEEGFFYPDELPISDPDGFEELQIFVGDKRNEAALADGLSRTGDGRRILLAATLVVARGAALQIRLQAPRSLHDRRLQPLFDFGRLCGYADEAKGVLQGRLVAWFLG